MLSHDQPIRLRFAPSPTGEVHLGSARTALFDYLFARHHGGKHVLRIEDTDRARYVAGAMDRFFEDLAWLGIEFDERPPMSAPYGPYVQSERARRGDYHRAAQQLLDAGDAYTCWCTPERLARMREAQAAAKQAPRYDRHCLNLSAEERAAKEASGEPFVIRMRVPTGQTTFTDLVRGTITIDNKEIDDQVLLKSDGFPTYHLAAVVDDHAMRISHVFRSEEWVPSTPKHILLYQMFGWQPPRFAHLPLILNKERRKLSKRKDGPGVWISTYRAQGYLPEAVVNYLAFMGWNPGDEREFFTMDKLIKEFSIERVHGAGAIFDIDKLRFINAHYLRKMTDLDLANKLRREGFVPAFKDFPEDRVAKWVRVLRDRCQTLSEFAPQIGQLINLAEYPADRLIFRKSDRNRTKDGLAFARQALQDSSAAAWGSIEALQALLGGFDASRLNNGDIFWPIRVALSGLEASPSPAELLWVLGKKESLARINTALNKLAA